MGPGPPPGLGHGHSSFLNTQVTGFGTTMGSRIMAPGHALSKEQASLEGGNAGPLGLKSEQKTAIQLECVLKERLHSLGLDTDCMLRASEMGDKMYAPACEAYLRILERVGEESGPYRRLCKRLCVGIENAMFHSPGAQLCVNDLLREAVRDPNPNRTAKRTVNPNPNRTAKRTVNPNPNRTAKRTVHPNPNRTAKRTVNPNPNRTAKRTVNPNPNRTRGWPRPWQQLTPTMPNWLV